MIKCIFILWPWNSEGSDLLKKDENQFRLAYTTTQSVNILAADDLATYGARASAAVVLL